MVQISLLSDTMQIYIQNLKLLSCDVYLDIL